MKWWSVPVFCLGSYALSVIVWWLLYWLRRPRSEQYEGPPRRVELPHLIVDVDALGVRGGNGKVHNEVIIKRQGNEH
jgi:hypothetical protein